MDFDVILNADCLTGMRLFPSHSMDMILCDLPYGKTARNKWDTPIAMSPLWTQYKRVVKPNGAIVLFGMGAFSAKLILAEESLYRYSLIWEKTTPTGFLNARKQPLRAHEDILVFYQKQPIYHPQKTTGHIRKTSSAKSKRGSRESLDYGHVSLSSYDSTERYPTSILRFPTDKQKLALHPTQKPVALLRWLIRTYTNPGDVVLDNACGNGSTCIAARLEGRHFIGMDNGTCENGQYTGWEWADIATARVWGCAAFEKAGKSSALPRQATPDTGADVLLVG